MRLVILGPPGSGKGTQAEGLRDRLSLVHLSTGDALRDAVKRGTELGKKAKSIMDAGGLVPDDLVAGIVEQRLGRGDCERFLLDGFPRTVGQVEMLDGILERLGLGLDRVLLLDVPEAEVVRRLTGRRTCGQCGWVCHLAFSPPKAEGVCDSCGGALIQRDDDTEETVKQRLSVYSEQTAPVADVYGKRGVLATVDGSGKPAEVLELLLGAVPQETA